jgi:hypothetical protein
MKMDDLKPKLEKLIIEKFLKADNCTQFYLESIKVFTYISNLYFMYSLKVNRLQQLAKISLQLI